MTLKHVIGTFVFAAILGGCPGWLWAQPAFPSKAMDAVNALYAGVNPQDDEARKVAIRRTCEQLSADLGPRWGGKKRAGLPDDYRSPDSLAYQEDDGTVSVWDIQASSGAILVHAGKTPDYPRLPPTEAAFMACVPTNHMGVPAPLPQPPPVVVVPPSTPPIDLSNLEGKIDTLAAALAAHEQAEAEFRTQARGVWEEFFKPVLDFTARYILPAVGAYLVGHQVAKE